MIVVPQIAFRAGEVAAGEALPPVRLVRELVASGAEQVALLDLDGSLARDLLPQWAEAIVAVAGVPLRFDGHLHDAARIERLARAGFATIVVDQSAVFEPMLLRWALDLFGSRLAVEVQVDGEYVFDPPPSAFDRELAEVVAQLHFRGVRSLVYRDVTGRELPLRQLMDLGERLPGMRIAYHGSAVRSVEDIGELSVAGRVLEAVLVDAQLVADGRIELRAAMRAARAPGG